MLPKRYSVSRTITINSTPEIIHRYVGDLNEWDKWGPWQQGNMDFKIIRGPVVAGVGAHQSWSVDDTGGELTFTRSDPATGIEYELLFNNGSYKSESSIKYDRSGNSTKVTWNMTGYTDMPFLGGYFALVINPVLGPVFQKSLNNLKLLVEN